MSEPKKFEVYKTGDLKYRIRAIGHRSGTSYISEKEAEFEAKQFVDLHRWQSRNKER